MQVSEAIVTVRAAMAPFKAYERIMEILEIVNQHEQKVRDAKEELKGVKAEAREVEKRLADLEADFSFVMKEYADTKAGMEGNIQAAINKAKAQVDEAGKRYGDLNAKIAMERDAFKDEWEKKQAELNGLKVEIQSAEAKLAAVNRQIKQLREKL